MSYLLTKKKFLSKTELDNLRKALDSCSKRDRVLVEVALATGARASEILAIRLEDLDPNDRSVQIRGIKGSRDRAIPLKADLFRELYDLARESGRPFGISYKRLHQIWLDIRPSKKGFHCLRHTAALRVYDKTKDLRLLKSFLGHSNIANTMIYNDYSYTASEMRRVL